MTTTEGTAVRPQRRAGTFTLGVVLVAAGLGMLASLFWPALDIRWLLKLSPLILVALGVEILLAAHGGAKVKYDWLGMILCFLLVGAGLCMYAAAWYVENEGFHNAYGCSRYAGETSYRMSYEYFNGFDSHTLRLEAGDVLEGKTDTWRGWLEVEVSGEDGETLLEGVAMNEEQSVEIAETGEYTILVHGRQTSGSFVFRAVHPETAESQEEGRTESQSETP